MTRSFTVVIERDPESGWLVGEVVELPGCYTQAPDQPSIQALVTSLTKGKTTEYAQVRALYDYFSSANGFKYALSTKSGSSGSDIVDFLNNKVGYCEQYAAALAWLVRAAHIPARVAFGFSRGSGHSGQTYTMTNLNLHAWTEVYFPGYGWITFEPSANRPAPVRPETSPSTFFDSDTISASAFDNGFNDFFDDDDDFGSSGPITLPPVLISLPFKLLLFVMIDGWDLITRALVTSYS